MGIVMVDGDCGDVIFWLLLSWVGGVIDDEFIGCVVEGLRFIFRSGECCFCLLDVDWVIYVVNFCMWEIFL